MTSRILPPEEWHRLTGTEVESIVPGLDPAYTAVLVVEDAGRIVGTWVLMRMAHLECLWIAPDRRGKIGVAAKLLRSMRTVAAAWGVTCPITASVTPEVSAMIRHFGGLPLPGEHFALPLGGQPCQP